MTPQLDGSILVGADEFVAGYVGAQLNATFKDYTALGVVRRGTFVGGVVYHEFMRMNYGNSIKVSFAFSSPSWALPETMRKICSYPFVQLDCVRVTALVAKPNKRSRQMVEFIGFTREGAHPKGIDGRETAISYGLLRENCRWIRTK